jgi:hypothetical protein
VDPDMSWHAIDSVDEAIEETKSFLSPFALRRWLKLALISLFVGTGGGSLFSLFNSASSLSSTPSEFNSTGRNVTGAGDPNMTVTGGMPTGEVPPPSQGLDAIGGPELGIIIAVFAVLVVLGLLLSILSDVLRFAFYEMLRTDEIRLVASAKRRTGQALRFFGFKLAVQLLTLAPFVLIIYLAIQEAIPVGTGVLILGVLLAAVVLLTSTVVNRITDEFVVPTMVATDSGVLDGWRRFWPVLRGNLAEFGVYLVVHFLLLLAIGIGQSILSLLVFGIVGVVGAVAGLVVVFGVFGGLSAATASTAGVALLVVIGGLTLLVALVLLLPVQIVVLTTVTTYEVSMLGAVDEDLRLRPATTGDESEPAVAD